MLECKNKVKRSLDPGEMTRVPSLEEAVKREWKGPLVGLRVLEFSGIGPGPFASMLLADMGADVVCVDRPGRAVSDPTAIASRGKRSVAVDLKSEQGIREALALAERADVVIEGFRPGVMERLGLGPDILLAINPKLIVGRMTGWGQTGPLSQAAGHDLNYIAISGALAAIGPLDGKPLPPLNLVGDFGGGSLYLVMGVLAALFETARSGRGQVIDAAMSDGAASLMSMFYGMRAAGSWSTKRGTNLLDGAAPFYNTYACADGKYVSIASIEPQFYALLREKAGLTGADFDQQLRSDLWPDLSGQVAAAFRTKSRAEWSSLLEGSDVCFAPVLDLDEAPTYPHNVARGTFVEREGVVQPAPAPRFSRTPGAIQGAPTVRGADRGSVFADWGVEPA
jgi:alpha-methylacyl-CoA racemase